MAQDVRPFRTGAVALFLAAAGFFGAGLWAQLNLAATDPVTRALADVAAPVLRAAIPEALGQPQTVFGTFAKFGGAVALLGLLLIALHGGSAPKPAPVAASPQIPRITPRRPADLRAARSAVSPAADAAAPPAPAPAAPPAPEDVSDALPEPGPRAGRSLHRAALMLIGTALTGIGLYIYISRNGLTLSGLPEMPTFGITTTAAALTLVAASVCAFTMLSVLRRRAMARKPA